MDSFSIVTTRRFCLLLVGGASLVVLLAALATSPLLRVGHFSAQSTTQRLPEGWKQIRFGENESSTRYDLVRRGSTVVVRARSRNGASGLITHQQVKLRQYPILEWRWKVDEVPEEADVSTDTTDDAAARLYVTFDYDDLGVLDRVKLMLLRRFGYSEAPSRALNYLWATRLSRNDVQESPYTDQIQMLAVRSGSTRVGEWVRERRNVWADYRRIFGEEPPPVNGVALMTDTDNTADSARAYYGDIVFRRAKADSLSHETK